MNKMRFFARAASILAIIWSIFQLYTAGFGFFHVMIQRPVHVSLALAVCFLIFPMVKTEMKQVTSDEDAPKNAMIGWFDFLLAALSIAVGIYALVNSTRIIERVYFVDKVFTIDVVAGIVLILLVLEAGRRVIGWILPFIAIIFLAYQFFGSNLPGILKHTGVAPTRFFDMMTLSPNGIYGSPIGVSTDTVFYFILFSVFLEISGGGKFFVDLAIRATGQYRGGPAKAAIVGSSLMGTISGSAVANAVGVGVFTIPLMKRAGYTPIFAASVEAVASTGGQIMPPIMGAAAFIMAQMLSVPYSQIALAAIIPALLFYVALFIAVDMRAKQDNLKGIDLSDMPGLAEDVKKRIHLMIPLVLLVYMIFSGFSMGLSAFVATISILPVAFLRKETRISFKRIIWALDQGGRRAIIVAVPCAIAGIIVGITTFSGLGLKFSSVLIGLSGGHLWLALVLVMFVCIVMGMGMPTTASYIIAAVLMAPTLIQMGVNPLAAHMFVFYFAVLSMVTPPVAMAAYATAGIAKTDAMKTGFKAWFLALNGFIIPYAFVYSPALLLLDTLPNIISIFTFTLIGIYSMTKMIISDSAPTWLRGVYGIAGLLLINPRLLTDMLGLLILVVALFVHKKYDQVRALTSNVSV